MSRVLQVFTGLFDLQPASNCDFFFANKWLSYRIASHHKMNIFRLAGSSLQVQCATYVLTVKHNLGDMTHLLSFVVLLLRLYGYKSAAGNAFLIDTSTITS